nr:hypothetical protein [Tanacetum cinerariifolium]
MNADEFLEMDPYEEVSQQGQVHPLSPAYISNPIKLDEHMPVHVPEPEHSEYHAPSDDDIQVKDDDEDPEEDPNDEDTREPSKGSDETEPFEEDETAVTPPPPRHRRARTSEPFGHKAAMIHRRDDIPEEDMTPRRRFAFTAPLPRYDIAESSAAAAARAPMSQYDFVDTIEAGQGLIRSPGHDAQTIARATDRAEDVGY